MSKQADKYEMVAHEFKFRQGGKLYCTHCGLMKLNNAFTDWAIRVGCMHKSHPSYDSKRFNFTELGRQHE